MHCVYVPLVVIVSPVPLATAAIGAHVPLWPTLHRPTVRVDAVSPPYWRHWARPSTLRRAWRVLPWQSTVGRGAQRTATDHNIPCLPRIGGRRLRASWFRFTRQCHNLIKTVFLFLYGNSIYVLLAPFFLGFRICTILGPLFAGTFLGVPTVLRQIHRCAPFGATIGQWRPECRGGGAKWF